ncbi:hypothetical protein E2P81_ATG10701 [Venturia nashicola]|nr:hypothetical protein E2P81_ATG10701 [Venturia nashicola]
MRSAQSSYSVAPFPKAFFPLRILQLILGLALLGISAYYVHSSTANHFDSPDYASLGLFTGIATVMCIIFWFVAATIMDANPPVFWIAFVLELFMLIMWLCTFAVLAARIAHNKPFLQLEIVRKSFPATLYTALAVSVLNFILFAITSILYTINHFKHRKTLAAEQTQAPGRVEQGDNVPMQSAYR